MKTYIVPIELTVIARDEKKALDEAREAIGLAIDTLLNEKASDLVAILDSTEYGEPYLTD